MISLRFFFVAILLTLTVSCGSEAKPRTLVVSAAADLQDAFTEFGQRFQTETGTPVEFNFAASGMLAEQIKAGAKVDVFAAANVEFVDQLENARLIIPDTKCVYAQGRLVVWSRKDAKIAVASLVDLRKPEFKRIAIANPVTAPYGIAASQALESAGLMPDVRDKLVYGENVRQTLELARSGNVDAAIVSLSLTRSVEGKSFLVPNDLYKPLNQGIAVIKGTRNEAAAKRFIDLLRDADGRLLLEKYGFIVEHPVPARD